MIRVRTPTNLSISAFASLISLVSAPKAHLFNKAIENRRFKEFQWEKATCFDG